MADSKCTVVVGSKDKLFSREDIDKIKKYPRVELKIIEGATHSLEIDEDYMKSLEILISVTKLCEDFIMSGTKK